MGLSSLNAARRWLDEKSTLFSLASALFDGQMVASLASDLA